MLKGCKINKKKKYHKLLLILLGLVSIILVAWITIVYLTYGKSGTATVINLSDLKIPQKDFLTLLSINMAHGRSDGKSQLLQRNDNIKRNVESIGELIKRERADLVALQEADAPSWWSGDISHVEMAAKISDMSHAVQAFNVNGLGLHYGTAILSNLQILDAEQVTFPMSFPTFSKGFTVAECQWPSSSMLFDFISIHLDFASPKVRQRQLKQLKNFIQQRNKPVIIAGDFNTNLKSEALLQFMKELELSVWQPENKEIITFPKLNKRIDWIFVSQNFKIHTHQVLDDVISDHRAIKITISQTNEADFSKYQYNLD